MRTYTENTQVNWIIGVKLSKFVASPTGNLNENSEPKLSVSPQRTQSMGLLGGSHVVVQIVFVSWMVKVTVFWGGPGQQVAQFPGSARGPEVSMSTSVQDPSIGGAWARA